MIMIMKILNLDLYFEKGSCIHHQSQDMVAEARLLSNQSQRFAFLANTLLLRTALPTANIVLAVQSTRHRESTWFFLWCYDSIFYDSTDSIRMIRLHWLSNAKDFDRDKQLIIW